MAEKQNMNDDSLITLVDDKGNETLYQILFTFQPDESDKGYVLLVPDDAQQGEQVDVTAFAYYPDEDGSATEAEFFEIEDDAEWEMVEGVLDTFLNDPNMQ